jgi:hypothetical protein
MSKSITTHPPRLLVDVLRFKVQLQVFHSGPERRPVVRQITYVGGWRTTSAPESSRMAV